VGRTLRIGTRGSALALAQTDMIVQWLQLVEPETTFEVVELVTHGDRHADTPITAMGDKVERGIFNSGLEEAILRRRVDLATCSFKDVESELPAGLVAMSVGPRADTRDVLISRHGCGLRQLPPNASIATSSPRRISQLRMIRPDLRFHPLRGNIPTRVQRAATDFDGVVIAAAGLIRLAMREHITEWIRHELLLPAAAQGALGCEFLDERDDLHRLVRPLQVADTELCTRAEKNLLIGLTGGCYAPIGVLAQVQRGSFALQARVVSLDGRASASGTVRGARHQSEELVRELCDGLIRQGAGRIIEDTREGLLAGA